MFAYLGCFDRRTQGARVSSLAPRLRGFDLLSERFQTITLHISELREPSLVQGLKRLRPQCVELRLSLSSNVDDTAVAQYPQVLGDIGARNRSKSAGDFPGGERALVVQDVENTPPRRVGDCDVSISHA